MEEVEFCWENQENKRTEERPPSRDLPFYFNGRASRPGPYVAQCGAGPYYTRVVEWGWGRVLLWPVEGNVLKA